LPQLSAKVSACFKTDTKSELYKCGFTARH
jgi:hypothetical protein